MLKDRTRADTVKELLAVIDSFEMAKGQLKPESEGEKRIDGSYQARRRCTTDMQQTPLGIACLYYGLCLRCCMGKVAMRALQRYIGQRQLDNPLLWRHWDSVLGI